MQSKLSAGSKQPECLIQTSRLSPTTRTIGIPKKARSIAIATASMIELKELVPELVLARDWAGLRDFWLDSAYSQSLVSARSWLQVGLLRRQRLRLRALRPAESSAR